MLGTQATFDDRTQAAVIHNSTGTMLMSKFRVNVFVSGLQLEERKNHPVKARSEIRHTRLGEKI